MSFFFTFQPKFSSKWGFRKKKLMEMKTKRCKEPKSKMATIFNKINFFAIILPFQGLYVLDWGVKLCGIVNINGNITFNWLLVRKLPFKGKISHEGPFQFASYSLSLKCYLFVCIIKHDVRSGHLLQFSPFFSNQCGYDTHKT